MNRKNKSDIVYVYLPPINKDKTIGSQHWMFLELMNLLKKQN